MRQFDFTTDIEERNPHTGNVYFVSRMTSGYAERHPFNVDAFIEDVYREFEGTEFEESREELRTVWQSTLSKPVGDVTTYPNANGAHRAAAMKVWHMAGDFWRRGFRTGDVLPERLPGCRITRLDDGWIALFPKDMHLLEDAAASEKEETRNPSQDLNRTMKPEPVQTELFASGGQSAPEDAQEPSRRPESRRRHRKSPQPQRPAEEPVLYDEPEEVQGTDWKKVACAAGAAAVTLLAIHFFGLLGPAVFGLICGGLLKG